jgi:hypothetical protein
MGSQMVFRCSNETLSSAGILTILLTCQFPPASPLPSTHLVDLGESKYFQNRAIRRTQWQGQLIELYYDHKSRFLDRWRLIAAALLRSIRNLDSKIPGNGHLECGECAR